MQTAHIIEPPSLDVVCLLLVDAIHRHTTERMLNADACAVRHTYMWCVYVWSMCFDIFVANAASR